MTDDRSPVATFWIHDDHAEPLGVRWRTGIPARHLPAAVATIGESFHAQQGDTAIFGMPEKKNDRGAFKKAGRLGLRRIVESDDCILSIDPRFFMAYALHLSWEPLGKKMLTQMFAQMQDRHALMARRADAVIVAMPSLAELYRPLNPNVFVCPNSLDQADWPAELRAVREPGPFRVGFAGSKSHSDDVGLVRDALAWASWQPDVEVRFIGWHPAFESPSWEVLHAHTTMDEMWALMQRALDASPDQKVPDEAIREAEELRLQEKAKVTEREAQWNFPLTVVDWTEDPDLYRRNLATLDVGLCPIDPAAPFNAGRSDLKVLELTAVGCLPIVSDCEIYRDWRGIVPMARSPEEFGELVQWAVTHRDEVRAKAAAVWEQVERTRTIDKTIGRWREAIRGDERASVAA